MKLKLVLSLSFFFIACNLPYAVVPATATPSPKPTIPPNTPGMLVRGHVTVNGVGLAGVQIYKRFSAYPRELIATTDENGSYESSFIYIPGDEMVSIEAELAGYSFDPPFYYWRHYHGYVEYTKDFSATAMP
jgi:hypothetical protein